MNMETRQRRTGEQQQPSDRRPEYIVNSSRHRRDMSLRQRSDSEMAGVEEFHSEAIHRREHHEARSDPKLVRGFLTRHDRKQTLNKSIGANSLGIRMIIRHNPVP